MRWLIAPVALLLAGAAAWLLLGSGEAPSPEVSARNGADAPSDQIDDASREALRKILREADQ